MYSVGLNNQPIQTQPIRRTVATAPIQAPVARTIPTTSHAASAYALSTVRTELSTADEKQKYTDLIRVAHPETRQSLQILLKRGALLNNDSDDKSTTLDNLHKIVTTQRAQGLDPQIVLKETVSAIANPFVINQQSGDIPNQYARPLVQTVKPNEKARNAAINRQSINVVNSSTCVSASVEFALAKQQPAEFARFAQALTSPNLSVQKTIDLKNLTENKQEAVALLDSFKIPYKKLGEDKVKVIFAPDNNAIIRARIQNSHKDAGERSLVDVLMQSTFMNVASQQSYESLTDSRGGHFSQDSKALVDYEKTFLESIVQNKNKTCLVYQTIDNEGRISGYTTDFKTMLNQITQTLKSGECVVAGYVFTDPMTQKVTGGHEITIIGITQDKNGDLLFICNDTDDKKNAPVTHKVSDLLPKINHVGIPTNLLS
ncbi:hypothetical protein IJV79_04555 [bacterium]|nr:hypothetical protein [bacterium]